MLVKFSFDALTVFYLSLKAIDQIGGQTDVTTLTWRSMIDVKRKELLEKIVESVRQSVAATADIKQSVQQEAFSESVIDALHDLLSKVLCVVADVFYKRGGLGALNANVMLER